MYFSRYGEPNYHVGCPFRSGSVAAESRAGGGLAGGEDPGPWTSAESPGLWLLGTQANLHPSEELGGQEMPWVCSRAGQPQAMLFQARGGGDGFCPTGITAKPAAARAKPSPAQTHTPPGPLNWCIQDRFGLGHVSKASHVPCLAEPAVNSRQADAWRLQLSRAGVGWGVRDSLVFNSNPTNVIYCRSNLSQNC